VSPDGVRVAFELERFEQTGEDRLEVVGRWYGVRGLRFVRPALTVQTKDGERNLLAVLEHKPWAAEEGEDWIAAFPWEGESPDPGEAELTVAPSVVVALAREQEQTGGGRKPTLRERLEESQKRARHAESEVAWLREEREALVADKAAAEREAERARAELAETERAHEALAEERDGARRERDAAARDRERALHDLEAAAAERDGAQGERDKLERERDDVLVESAKVAEARDAAERERAAMERERDEARRERDSMVSERDGAVEERASALAERDAALGRGAGFPAVSAADLSRQPHTHVPGERTPTPHRSRLPAMSTADPMARVIAVGALITLLLLVILLLKIA
jgi:hypothetical protein